MFIYIHILCMRAAKPLESLHNCIYMLLSDAKSTMKKLTFRYIYNNPKAEFYNEKNIDHNETFLMGRICLIDLILYVPSTILQLNRDGSSCVEPVLSRDKCVLLKDHNAVTPMRLRICLAMRRITDAG